MGATERSDSRDKDRENLNEEPTFLQCQWDIFRISLPTIISCLFMQLTYFINTVYAGHLNDESKLAGLGLGTCLLECLTLYIIMGMNGALETLVSHAYGANQLVLCGVYLNRARVINTTIFIPLASILLFTREVLMFLGQEESVVEHAHTYIIANLPSVYMLGIYDMTKRFLNCMESSWVQMVA